MTRPPRIDSTHTPGWVLVGELEMTPQQWGRPIRASDARRIAIEFDPDAFGNVAVWHRPDREPLRGRYVIVDGQHRVQALRIMGWEDQAVPCLLYQGLTIERAAELSLALQDRRNLHTLDKHRANVAAHEHRAVEVDKVLRAADVQLVYSTRPDANRQCCAVGALLNCWDLLGVDGLERVLAICDRAWEGTAAGFGSAIVKLVMTVVAAHADRVNDARLADVLGTRSPAQWVAAGFTPRRSTQQLAQDVVIEYNRRTRGAGRLPELTPSDYVNASRRAPVKTIRAPLDPSIPQTVAQVSRGKVRTRGRKP